MSLAAWITIAVVVMMIYGVVQLGRRKELTEEEFERQARRPSLLRTGLQELQGFFEPSKRAAQEAILEEKNKSASTVSGEGPNPGARTFGQRMNHVEVCVHAEVDSGELVGMFTGVDPSGAWEIPGEVHIFWPEDLWDSGFLTELRSILSRLGIPDRPGLITASVIADRDWNQAWARSLSPIRVGKGIAVRQSWNLLEGPPAKVELIIDPKRAFGSGYHATTRLLLEWLEDEIRGGEEVLDVGTGSGILAMAALRLGAAAATAIDSDPVAVECAREYAAVNGFGPELDLRVQGIADIGRGEYDVIVANLDRPTLLGFSARLVPLLAAEGRLLLSGLQAGDYRDIAGELAGVGDIVARRERDEWIALMVRDASHRAGER